jgi:hypothetical protein
VVDCGKVVAVFLYRSNGNCMLGMSGSCREMFLFLVVLVTAMFLTVLLTINYDNEFLRQWIFLIRKEKKILE